VVEPAETSGGDRRGKRQRRAGVERDESEADVERDHLIVRVVPDVKGMERELDYLVPESLRDQVRVGTLGRIPLGPRRERAWVVAVGVTPPPGVALREITKVTGHGPPADVVDVAAWAAWRWAGRRAHLLVPASPPTAVRMLPAAPARRPVPSPQDPLACEALAAGGGVVRLPPAADRLPVVLAAVARGNTLVVTPSVDEAHLLAARMRRAGVPVALAPRDWAIGYAGATVVGAQAAAWAPVGELAAVVVLDEHDEAMRHESAPTWSARDVALERACRAGVPSLLVSPVPSLDALAWAEREGRPVLTPSRNDERAGWPVLQVVDRSQDEPWAWGPISAPLERHLRDPDVVVVCVLNAPGRARRLACRACHATTRCERCDAAVVLLSDADQLHCPRCGTDRPVVCQACGSSALVPVRPGVSRLREQVEVAADRAVVEITGARPASEPVPPADVYVGTEAVLHRVPRADVVAFLDIDAELLAPRFRAAEEALGLLARAARLVGGRASGGRLLVQTRLAHHDVLDAVLRADPGRMVPAERERRAALGFPPAQALAVVDGPEAARAVAGLRERPDVSVAGPAGGRWLVRAPTWEALADALAAVPRPPGKVRVEVDPRRI
jgi:primosomal protein N' (replication factor Y)